MSQRGAQWPPLVYAAWGGHANVVHYLLQAGAGKDAHEALRCISGTGFRRSLGERCVVVRQILEDYLAKNVDGAEVTRPEWGSIPRRQGSSDYAGLGAAERNDSDASSTATSEPPPEVTVAEGAASASDAVTVTV